MRHSHCHGREFESLRSLIEQLSTGSVSVDSLYGEVHVEKYTTPKETTWKEFQSTGLLLFINTFLHIFGWCIVIECDDEGAYRAYPARTSWRGFSEDSMTRAYQKLTKSMQEDIPQLLEDTKE